MVLATDMSLDFGFSKALLIRWAAGAANTVLLTGRAHGSTTARALMALMTIREDRARAAVRMRMKGYSGGGVGGGGSGGGGRVGVEEGEEEEDEEAALKIEVKVRD